MIGWWILIWIVLALALALALALGFWLGIDYSQWAARQEKRDLIQEHSYAHHSEYKRQKCDLCWKLVYDCFKVYGNKYEERRAIMVLRMGYKMHITASAFSNHTSEMFSQMLNESHGEEQ